MREIGLLPEDEQDEYKQMINTQMTVALSKIPILPWTYLVDLWRWKVFAGEIKPDEYQSSWLKLVARYQGNHFDGLSYIRNLTTVFQESIELYLQLRMILTLAQSITSL